MTQIKDKKITRLVVEMTDDLKMFLRDAADVFKRNDFESYSQRLRWLLKKDAEKILNTSFESWLEKQNNKK